MSRTSIHPSAGDYVGPVEADTRKRIVFSGCRVYRQSAPEAHQRRHNPVAKEMGHQSAMPKLACVDDAGVEEIGYVIRARTVVPPYVVRVFDLALAQRNNRRNTQAFRPRVIGEERIIVCKTVLNSCLLYTSDAADE